jgi:hypothetical protein
VLQQRWQLGDRPDTRAVGVPVEAGFVDEHGRQTGRASARNVDVVDVAGVKRM